MEEARAIELELANEVEQELNRGSGAMFHTEYPRPMITPLAIRCLENNRRWEGELERRGYKVAKKKT